jgi:hypothetical protein
MAVSLSTPLTGHTVLPRNMIIFRFFYAFLLEADEPQGLVLPEGLVKLKILPHRVSNPRLVVP